MAIAKLTSPFETYLGCTAHTLEEPHVFVLDRRGNIVWRGHGDVTDAKIEQQAALPPVH